jgi:hypothetical protein
MHEYLFRAERFFDRPPEFSQRKRFQKAFLLTLSQELLHALANDIAGDENEPLAQFRI